MSKEIKTYIETLEQKIKDTKLKLCKETIRHGYMHESFGQKDGRALNDYAGGHIRIVSDDDYHTMIEMVSEFTEWCADANMADIHAYMELLKAKK